MNDAPLPFHHIEYVTHPVILTSMHFVLPEFSRSLQYLKSDEQLFYFIYVVEPRSNLIRWINDHCPYTALIRNRVLPIVPILFCSKKKHKVCTYFQTSLQLLYIG